MMSKVKLPTTARAIALGGAAVIALALGLFGFSGTSQADFPHAGLNFSIEAVGESGCDTSAGDATCFIQPGTTFVLNVALDPLPTDIPGYSGYDLVLNYSGLTSLDDGSTDSWPDCGFPASSFNPGVIALACAIGIQAPLSTYTGVVGTNSFTCDQSGTISLVSGPGNTDLVETVGSIHGEGDGTVETLNITCGDPPTPTSPAAATTTATSAPPTATVGAIAGTGSGGTDDSTDAPWMLVGLLTAAAATGLGAAGWRVARRR